MKSVEQMRIDIAGVYPGMRWQSRVANMAPSQVIAVYHSFVNTGRFEKKRKENLRKKKNGEQDFHQFSIFDYIDISKGELRC